MHRLRRLLVLLSFLAIVAAPAVAEAQPGDRPATQLFMAPTGRVLPKGQGYFKSFGLIAVPLWQGGVTDRFSLGIGLPMFALARVAVLTPKFQIQRSENHSTSIGAVEVLTTEGSYGIGYAAHTFELKKGALHFAAIAPFVRTGARHVAVMFGAEHRINDHVMFMTENYYFPGGPPLFSGGVRVKAPHTTWDFGMLIPATFEYGARPSPMISGGYKF